MAKSSQVYKYLDSDTIVDILLLYTSTVYNEAIKIEVVIALNI